VSDQKGHPDGELSQQHPLGAISSADTAEAEHPGGSGTVPGPAAGEKESRLEGATPVEAPLPKPDPALPSHDEELAK
jgi:hypothetical protein